MPANADARALEIVAELRQVERLSGVLKVDVAALIEWTGEYQLAVRDVQVIEKALKAMPALLDIAEAAIALVQKCRECDGTGVVWANPTGHRTAECPICAPLSAAIAKLAAKQGGITTP